MIVNLNRRRVASGRTMRAGDGVWGGDTIVQPITARFVLNQGIIRAGRGDFGGRVTIQPSVPAMASNHSLVVREAIVFVDNPAARNHPGASSGGGPGRCAQMEPFTVRCPASNFSGFSITPVEPTSA